MAFRSPPEFGRTDAVVGGHPRTTASLAVCSPSTSSRCRAATCPGATNSQVRALSAFRTLSGLCSARRLPALFHAGPAHGVSPFRDDLHPQSRASSRTPLPSCGWPTILAPSRPPRLPRAPGDARARLGRLSRRRRFRPPAPLQGLAPCEWPCRRADCSGQPFDRDPRGFLLPRGFSLSAGGPPRGPSSLGLGHRCAR